MSRRRSARTLILALVTALAVAFAGGSVQAAGGGTPSEGGQGAPGGGSAQVTTRCSGGPGRLTVAVAAQNQDGDYRVTVTGDRMAEGSTWKVLVEWEDGQQQRFRRTPVDGSWSLSTVMEASRHQPAFDVGAYGSVGGELRLVCYNVIWVGQATVGGLGGCGNGLIALLAKRRDDGSTAVLAFLLRGSPRQQWTLDLRAVAAGAQQTVSFQDYSNRWSELGSRVRFDSLGADPRLHLRISNSRGARCWIRLVPGSYLTATSSSSLDGTTVPRLLRQRSDVH